MLSFRLFSRRPRRACREARAVSPTATPVEALEARQLLTVATGFTETLVAGGLTQATKVTVAPDGRLFVSLQGGQVRIVKNGQLLSEPFLSVNTENRSERGLMGLAFDPNFASNHFVYAYYTTLEGGAHNRVSRFTANGDTVVPGSEKVLIDCDPLGDSGWHNGGALEFGKDGKLYVAVGENNWAQDAQQFTNTRGKILRLNPDGTIPTDNPFLDRTSGKAQAIWAMGVRNPFSMDVQPGTGRLVIGDVGAGAFEEINDGKAGANYGWPETQGATDDPRFQTPIHAYPHSFGKSAITGVNFYNPANPTFPSEYVGDVFFADYNGGFIKRIDLATKAVSDFGSNLGLVADTTTAQDGSLYYLTRDNGGRLFRVTWSGGGGPGSGPTAPTVAVPPQDVTVAAGQSATFSVQAGGTAPFSYQWRRNGADIAGATAASYTVPAAAAADNGATYAVVVTNAAGKVTSGAAKLTVVNDQPPTATITAPAAGALWRAGGQLAFAGVGTDPETGALPPSAFTWEVVFHHDDHTHPFVPPYSGVSSDAIDISDIGEVDPDIFYRVHLTVRDAAGLTHSTSIDVHPQKVDLSLRTEPAGLPLTLDDQPVPSPLDTKAVVGLQRRVGAPETQTINGVVYEFVSWSDGGAATHGFATPDVSTTLTAVYRPRVTGGGPGGDPGGNPGGDPGGDPGGNPGGPGADLAVDAVTGSAAAGVVGHKAKTMLRVANRGTMPFSGAANLELFLSADGTLDAGDVPVTNAVRRLKLKAGAARAVPVSFAYPAVPAGDGNFFMLARVRGGAADVNPANDVAASTATLPVRNPVVDLLGSFAPSRAGAVARGGRGTASVMVLNAGTEALSGPVAMTLFAVPEGTDPLSGPRTPLATLTKTVTINPTRGKRVKLGFAVPATLAPGSYALVLAVDTAGAVTEPDEANNTAVSPIRLIVT